MQTDPGGLRQWTERFTVASATFLVLSVATVGLVGETRLAAILALFGFVCPMIFGMAYLLLPPYVGTTLIDHRLPGIHFGLAYLGVGLLVVGWVREGSGTLFTVGAIVWSAGVAVFLTALLATIAPVVLEDPRGVFERGDRPQRSTRLATAMIPIAIGYLAAGTVLLLDVATVLDLGAWMLSHVSHLYAVGFGALLIFSLGARLLIGFYHVSPPRYAVWPVLISGTLAPGLLTATMWIDPWFQIGAALESLAMVGYLFVVASVGRLTDCRRFGLLGIFLGAVAGVVAVLGAVPLAFGSAVLAETVTVHRTLVLWGFFTLTIVGYAFLFFPVTEGQFRGATRRGATATVLLLGGGLAVRVLGIGIDARPVQLIGVVVTFLGAVGYASLLTRRFYG